MVSGERLQRPRYKLLNVALVSKLAVAFDIVKWGKLCCVFYAAAVAPFYVAFARGIRVRCNKPCVQSVCLS